MNLEALEHLPAQWRSRVLAPVIASAYALCAFGFAWDASVGAASLGGLGLVVCRGLAGHFVAATLWLLQICAGVALLAELGWSRELRRKSELLVFGWTAGFVLVSGAWMALAGLGSLNTWTVSASTGVIAALTTWRLLRGNARALWSTLGAGAASGSDPPTLLSPAIVWGSALGMLALCIYWAWPLLVQTALPNSDWDSALYHLPLAERYLDGALWSSDPFFSAHSFPGAVSLVYAALMSIGYESAIIPYNFIGVLVTLVAVAALAARLTDERAAGWAVLVGAGVHILWQLGVDPRVDVFLCIAVAAAVLALVIFAEDRSRHAPLLLLALALNTAMGTKYTGLFIGFAVAGLAFMGWAIERLRGRAGPPTRALALALVLLVVPNGAWYVANVVNHGDPLFPMLRGDYYEAPDRPGERIPTSGALDPVLETLTPESPQRRFAAGLTQRYEAESAPEHLFDLLEMARNPNDYAVKPNHFGSPLLLLFLALPLALARGSRERLGGLALYVVALACYLALGSQANLLRYVLPVLMLFAAGAGVVIAHFPNRIWHAACLALAILLLFQHREAESIRLESLHPSAYVEAGGDRVAWLQHAGYNLTTAMPFVIERINHDIQTGEMSASDLILMIGEGKGRLLDCRTLPDLSWFLQRWAIEYVLAEGSHEAILGSLRAQGVTHVLYNRGYFDWVLRKTETPTEEVAFAMFELERFLEEHARQVFRIKGIRLYELEPALPGGS